MSNELKITIPPRRQIRGVFGSSWLRKASPSLLYRSISPLSEAESQQCSPLITPLTRRYVAAPLVRGVGWRSRHSGWLSCHPSPGFEPVAHSGPGELDERRILARCPLEQHACGSNSTNGA